MRLPFRNTFLWIWAWMARASTCVCGSMDASLQRSISRTVKRCSLGVRAYEVAPSRFGLLGKIRNTSWSKIVNGIQDVSGRGEGNLASIREDLVAIATSSPSNLKLWKELLWAQVHCTIDDSSAADATTTRVGKVFQRAPRASAGAPINIRRSHSIGRSTHPSANRVDTMVR